MTNTWLTPPAIVEALGGWESFDLDPCASQAQPFRTAQRQVDEIENGLLVHWHGRVFLNPPYSSPLLARFLARMAGHGIGTALTFARTETEFFQRFVWPIATGVLFLAGRLQFLLPDGSPSGRDANASSMLIAYGSRDLDVLAAAPIEGAFVPLQFPRSMLVVVAVNSTWADVLAGFFCKHEAAVPLAEIYRALADHPKTRGNKFWRDKVRQELQLGDYARVERGVWKRRA